MEAVFRIRALIRAQKSTGPQGCQGLDQRLNEDTPFGLGPRGGEDPACAGSARVNALESTPIRCQTLDREPGHGRSRDRKQLPLPQICDRIPQAAQAQGRYGHDEGAIIGGDQLPTAVRGVWNSHIQHA